MQRAQIQPSRHVSHRRDAPSFEPQYRYLSRQEQQRDEQGEALEPQNPDLSAVLSDAFDRNDSHQGWRRQRLICSGKRAFGEL